MNIVIAIVTIVNMKNFRTFEQKNRSNTYHILLNEFSSRARTLNFQYFFSCKSFEDKSSLKSGLMLFFYPNILYVSLT